MCGRYGLNYLCELPTGVLRKALDLLQAPLPSTQVSPGASCSSEFIHCGVRIKFIEIINNKYKKSFVSDSTHMIILMHDGEQIQSEK